MRICEYGCGREAEYQFKNGKWCCSKNHARCLTKREEHSVQMKKLWEDPNGVFNLISWREKRSEANKNLSEETRKRMSESRKGIKPWNKGKTGVYSEKTLKEMSEAKRKEWEDLKSEYNSVSYREKIRISAVKRIEKQFGRCYPNYSRHACKLIEEYGKKHGYKFDHAENGGEFYIKELGYWIDGYDKESNSVIEVDESHHFDHNGNLKERDIQRQKEIIEFLNCEFIRIKI